MANGGADRNRGSLLNGSSLSALTGARVSSKEEVRVQLPASSMAEVLETVHRLGHTGNLTVNFHKGKALDMRWTQTRAIDPPDGQV